MLILSLYFDIRENKIKNFITLPAAMLGIILNTLEKGIDGLLFSITGWVVPVVFLIILYFINVMGAGDIKLYAAIGAIMGMPFVLYSFIFSVYFGGLIAIVLLLKRKEFIYRIKNIVSYFLGLIFSLRIIPYCRKNDTYSKFAFSIAIVPAALLEFILNIKNIKGL